jgi:hypothetical protein
MRVCTPCTSHKLHINASKAYTPAAARCRPADCACGLKPCESAMQRAPAPSSQQIPIKRIQIHLSLAWSGLGAAAGPLWWHAPRRTLTKLRCPAVLMYAYLHHIRGSQGHTAGEKRFLAGLPREIRHSPRKEYCVALPFPHRTLPAPPVLAFPPRLTTLRPQNRIRTHTSSLLDRGLGCLLTCLQRGLQLLDAASHALCLNT